MSEEGGGVRHMVVTLNKSGTLRFDKPFASAVVGARDIVDALPMSDRVLYIQGKKIGTKSARLGPVPLYRTWTSVMTAERLKQLGFENELQPIKVSCADHEGTRILVSRF